MHLKMLIFKIVRRIVIVLGTKMVVACLCSSDRKTFLLNTTNVRLRDACPNASGMKVAQNLLQQDYEALGNCVPPEENSYVIRLIYNPCHEKCHNNHTHPYFWGRTAVVTTNRAWMASLLVYHVCQMEKAVTWRL